MDNASKIIIALDCPVDQALSLAQSLAGRAQWLKVGMTLFYREGPKLVREFKELGYRVFVDLKLHDIPHQVQGAAASVVACGADMFTVHTSGGVAMMRAAVEGALSASSESSKPMILGVTVLTSMNQENLSSVGVSNDLETQVRHLALLAQEAGLSGIVCSPQEAAAMRELLGPNSAIVTPGVRMQDDALGDQVRVMTPARAIAAGASHLVIGRPITQADNPIAAFDRIVESMEG